MDILGVHLFEILRKIRYESLSVPIIIAIEGFQGDHEPYKV